jgi:hypothetical protein
MLDLDPLLPEEITVTGHVGFGLHSSHNLWATPSISATPRMMGNLRKTLQP